jgi:hypothetical protein
MNVIETSGLTKTYGSTRALWECTLAIPGSVRPAGLDDRRSAVTAPWHISVKETKRAADVSFEPTAHRLWPSVVIPFRDVPFSGPAVTDQR